MSDRIKFEMEFPIKVSQKLLFQYISTPSGLSEWFADNVNSRGEIFIFIWDDSEESAKLLRKNNNPDLWLLLSEIQRSSKNIIGYHQSRAEYFLLLGQNERALNQLEFALKLTQNNFQVSERIMTKIVEIKKEINESRGL